MVSSNCRLQRKAGPELVCQMTLLSFYLMLIESGLGLVGIAFVPGLPLRQWLRAVAGSLSHRMAGVREPLWDTPGTGADPEGELQPGACEWGCPLWGSLNRDSH